MRQRTRVLAAGLGVLLIATGGLRAAHAQDYPSPAKPIRIVMPFAAGGSGDVVARLLAQKMGDNMKTPIIIDNKGGAGGSLGAMDIAKSPPDGYNLLMGTSSTHGINPAIYSSLKYDAYKDFTFISPVALSEYALVVPADSPYHSVAELVAAAKAGKDIRYSSSGNGTTSHLAAALFATRTGANFIHIPYKSSPQALTDLIGGQVDFHITNTSAVLPYEQTGKLHILATTAKQRAEVTKNVPTMIEAGVKDYEVIGWWAMFAPAGTPAPILDRLNLEMKKALADPVLKEKMSSIGADPFYLSRADTQAFIAAELKKFKAIVDAAGAKID